MVITLPHGDLFHGGAEKEIREKLLQAGYIDTVIGLPANLSIQLGFPCAFRFCSGRIGT